MSKFTSRVVGTTYRPQGQETLAAIQSMKEYPPCRLVPEPTNPYDPNAIAVMIAVAPGDVRHVGYLPKDLAKQVAPQLEGENVMASIVEILGGFEMWDGSIAHYGMTISVEFPDKR